MRYNKDWLPAYMEWTKNLESPELFHRWIGIGTLAATMGRNVHIQRGGYVLFPNQYIILLAASADCRKSTAIDQALKLVRDLDGFNIRSGKITTAMLYKVLSDVALINDGVGEILITADELSMLFSKDEATAALLSVLTEGYSGNKPLIKETKTAGTDTIPRPCFNLWAATTPADLRDIFPEKTTGMGFSSRNIIIHQEKPRDKNPWPAMDSNLQNQLTEDLKIIRGIKGVYMLEKEAKEWFDDWYYNNDFKGAENIIGAYQARKHDYLLKIGMVMAMSKSNELVIKKIDLLKSLEHLQEVEPFLQDAYGEIGRTKETAHFDSILKQMERRKGTATRRELLQANWRVLNCSQLMEIMGSLVASGKVLPAETTPSKNKTTTITWKLVKKGEENE